MSDTDINSDIVKHEKIKLMNINQYNVQILNKLKTFVELLDKIEYTLNKQSTNQLNEILELKKIIEEHNDMFVMICTNILNQI
jgi:hypothetical protein